MYYVYIITHKYPLNRINFCSVNINIITNNIFKFIYNRLLIIRFVCIMVFVNTDKYEIISNVTYFFIAIME